MALGIDLGTSFTTAAVAHAGKVEMVGLGNHAAAMPSAVFLRDDGEFLVGEAALRRGIDDPSRVAREFKRRLGDQTPILLAHSPYSAERLMAALLRQVIGEVASRYGERPGAMALAHPANWGAYKVDLLHQAAQLAGIPEAHFVTEPEAAAVHFAAGERVEPGEIVAVYDLGGGTFDAAVLQRTDDGFRTLGSPHGIERLGGIDFDDAVLSHVMAAIDAPVERDTGDPAMRSALARLRTECVAAKEALSADTDATIPVVLPGLHTHVRITRAEFEAAIRPLVTETITVLRQAISSAGIAPDDLKSIVLAGGSSRIPLVAELVRSEFGRPVALDAHPKHTVALGAAMLARDRSEPAGPPEVTPDEAPATVTPPPVTAPVDVPVDVPVSASMAEPAPRSAGRPGRRTVPVVVGGLVALAALAGLGALVLGGGDDTRDADPGPGAELTQASTIGPPGSTSPTEDTTAASAPSTETTAPEVLPPSCTTTNGRCAFIDDIRVEGDSYVVAYTTVGFEPLIDGGDESHHLHFFFDTVPLEQAGVPGTGPWVVWDLDDTGQKLFRGEQAFRPSEGPPGATAICVTVATVGHAVDPGATADCRPLP